MTIYEIQWWLAAICIAATAILRAMGEDWKYSAFWALVAVGMLAA